MNQLTIPAKVADDGVEATEFNSMVGAINSLIGGDGNVKTYDTPADLPASISGTSAQLVFVRSNANLEPDAYILFGNKKFIVTLIPQQ